MKTDSAAIATLHHEYRQLTGFDLKLDFYRERVWWEWCQRGNDVESLRLVVGHLKRQIYKGERNGGSLKFHNLIGNLDFFDEDHAIAKAEARKPKIDQERASVLRATGRTENHTSPPRTAAQVMADDEAFKKFREFGKTL